MAEVGWFVQAPVNKPTYPPPQSSQPQYQPKTPIRRKQSQEQFEWTPKKIGAGVAIALIVLVYWMLPPWGQQHVIVQNWQKAQGPQIELSDAVVPGVKKLMELSPPRSWQKTLEEGGARQSISPTNTGLCAYSAKMGYIWAQVYIPRGHYLSIWAESKDTMWVLVDGVEKMLTRYPQRLYSLDVGSGWHDVTFAVIALCKEGMGRVEILGAESMKPTTMSTHQMEDWVTYFGGGSERINEQPSYETVLKCSPTRWGPRVARTVALSFNNHDTCWESMQTGYAEGKVYVLENVKTHLQIDSNTLLFVVVNGRKAFEFIPGRWFAGSGPARADLTPFLAPNSWNSVWVIAVCGCGSCRSDITWDVNQA